MKAFWMIIVLTFCTWMLWAASESEGYVVADGKTYVCETMRTGFANTRILTAEGQLIKVPNNSIQAYRLNGRQFEVMPLINLRGDTLGMAFMELISVCNGKRLYRYCSNCSKYDPLSGEIAPINRIYRYYVLSGKQLKLMPEPCNSDLALFNVKIVNDQSHR